LGEGEAGREDFGDTDSPLLPVKLPVLHEVNAKSKENNNKKDKTFILILKIPFQEKMTIFYYFTKVNFHP